MKFKMTVDSCNSDQDLSRILRGVADRVQDPDLDPDTQYRVLDLNGNTVGHFEVEDESCEE